MRFGLRVRVLAVLCIALLCVGGVPSRVQAQVTIQPTTTFGDGGEGDVAFEFNEDLVVVGEHVYVAADNKVYQYLLDASGGMTLLRDFGNTDELPSGSAEVTSDGTYLFVGGFSPDISVYDVSNPEAPAFQSTLNVQLFVRDMVARDGTLIVLPSRPEQGIIFVYDYTDPTALRQIGSYFVNGFPSSAAWAGEIVYLTVFSTGMGDNVMEAIDLSDPAQPSRISSTLIVGLPTFVRVQGTTAIVSGRLTAEDGWSLTALDVNDPANPVEQAHEARDDEGVVLDLRFTAAGRIVLALHLKGYRILSVADGAFVEEASAADETGVNDFQIVDTAELAAGKRQMPGQLLIGLTGLRNFFGDRVPTIGSFGFSSDGGRSYEIIEEGSDLFDVGVSIEPADAATAGCAATASPNEDVAPGTTVELEADAGCAGFAFTGWTGDATSATPSSSFTMPNRDAAVTANYEPVNLIVRLRGTSRFECSTATREGKGIELFSFRMSALGDDWQVNTARFEATGTLPLVATTTIDSLLIEVSSGSAYVPLSNGVIQVPINTVLAEGESLTGQVYLQDTLPLCGTVAGSQAEPITFTPEIRPPQDVSAFAINVTDFGLIIPSARQRGAEVVLACVQNMTQEAGFAGIQAAINAAQLDDAIGVCPGAYSESLTVDTEGLTLFSFEGAARTRVHPPGVGKRSMDADVVTLSAPDTELQGFTITGGRNGVVVTEDATSARIGESDGARPQANHIVGHSEAGILLQSEEATVIGNWIGAAPVGQQTRPQPNQHGIRIDHSHRNAVLENVISGNTANGIVIEGLDGFPQSNQILGNWIGTDADGTCVLVGERCPLGNGAAGIELQEADSTTLAENTIAYNATDGIRIDEGLYNQISRNSIFANGRSGIDLVAAQDDADTGTTPNDEDDADDGPNRLQNYPEPDSVVARLVPQNNRMAYLVDQFTYQWVLAGAPASSVLAETFANTRCGAAEQGEGQTYLTFAEVTTQDEGFAAWTTASPHPHVAATATDAQGNTSEFSNTACVRLLSVALHERSITTGAREAQAISTEETATTFEGDPIRVLSAWVNEGHEPVTVFLDLRDVRTGRVLDGRFLRDDALSDTASVRSRFTIAAGDTLNVEFEWDTDGWAWENGWEQAERELVITAELDGDTFDTIKVATSPIPIPIRPRPVVMVHGLASNAAAFTVAAQRLASAHSWWNGALFAVGDGVYPGQMNTGQLGNPFARTNTIAQNADELRTYLQAVREDLQAWQVDLIVHSMGGLISRYYIQHLLRETPDGDSEIKRLIQLGTPNEGSVCAYGRPAFTLWPAMHQLRPDYVARFNQATRNQKGIPFYIVAGDPFSDLCGVNTDGSDGVVSLTSALARTDGIPRFHDDITFPFNHVELTDEIIIFNDFIVPVLSGERVGIAPSEPAPVLQARRVEENPLQLLQSEELALDAGTTVELTLVVADGERIVFGLAGSAQVQAELRDPSGAVVGDETVNRAAAHAFSRTASILNPAAGDWTLALTNTGSSRAQVAVTMAVQGASLTLTVGADAPQAGTAVPITATLADAGTPVTGATLTARLFSTDFSDVVLTLMDDGQHSDGDAGDGVYGATSPELPPSLYGVEVVAEGGFGIRMASELVDLSTTATAPFLSRLSIVPEQITLASGETHTFSLAGFDQYGAPMTAAGEWRATGGTIDSTGLYTAGGDMGAFEVTVRDPNRFLEATAQVEISGRVATEEIEAPTAFALHGNYPNPFNPATVIRYDLPEASRVRMEVYNVLGQRVALLVDGTKSAGPQQQVWEAGASPSGTYVVRLVAEGLSGTRFQASHTMVLLR